MFTGFASENTPAIQVWDFFRTFGTTSAFRSVSLADDCAPIQVFRTGATGVTNILVYLPTAPIEGKTITIVNQNYGPNTQSVQLFSSDTSSGGSQNSLYTLGAGDSVILVYSKQCISYGPSAGSFETGWVSLNKSSITSSSFNAVIAGGNSNNAVGRNTFVGGGSSNSASSSGPNAAVVGGANNTASNTASIVVGGQINTASGTNAAVLGGTNSTSSSTSAVVIGGSQGTTRSINGIFVTPASVSPVTGAAGRTQHGILLLGRQTTDATATVLTSDTSAAGTTNQIILPNNSAYTFQGTAIANVTGGGNTSGWKFEGVIKRGANAASTTLVAAVTPTVIAQDAGAATWVVAVTADTTNGGIAVTCTGQAATTIRWVCKIETTEVTF